ncbi:MAG: hypothetical protein IJY17_03575 [Alphaproteobacteria bacterium]|nr:hypothetical protein [Alphaproteobacteria bacterium]
MYVSDVAEQIVAMQTQMIRSSMAMAAAKSAIDQQKTVTTLLTEAIQSAAASADGRGALLDILV